MNITVNNDGVIPQEKQNGSEEYHQEDRKITYNQMRQIRVSKKMRVKNLNKNRAKQ